MLFPLRRFLGLIFIALGIFIAGSYFYTKYYLFSITIKEDPVVYMKQLEQEHDWQRLEIYADFVRHMPFSDSTKKLANQMYEEAKRERSSLMYNVKGCMQGLASEDVNSLSSAICDFGINLTPIGDIRDLGEQFIFHVTCGLSGVWCNEEDNFIAALSAIGIALTFTPELNITDSMLKVLKEAKAISTDMVEYILKLGKDALHKFDLSAVKDFMKVNWEYFSAFRKFGFEPIQDTYIYAKDGRDVEKMVKLTKEYKAPEAYVAILETDGKVLRTDKPLAFFSPKFSILNIIKSGLKTGKAGAWRLMADWIYNKLGVFSVVVGLLIFALGVDMFSGDLIIKILKR
ncbi:MAG: hypothetical protein C0172_00585 [Caldisphaera sp.]|nr:MAG: hypothetical protein C0172_00585 [Caldisphaera sp.]